MRVQFNEGQEVKREDFNKLQAGLQQELYDRVVYEMNKRTTNSFYDGSFKVSRTDSNTVSLAAGLGFQQDLTLDPEEPVQRPVFLSAALPIDITAAHGSLNRIDIVCVKSDIPVSLTEMRRYKATVEALPTLQSFDVETEWEATCQIVAGSPNVSPVAPATPSGYIRIASILVTAVTGIVASSSITDERSLIPSIGRATAGYQAIVGTPSYCTHTTLAAAIAAVSAGDRILIVSNLDIATSVTINKANLLIEGMPGVTINEDGAATGFIISAAGVRLKSLRFLDFTTAISITDTFNNNFITECRFNNCTTEINDLNTTPNNVLFMNLTE